MACGAHSGVPSRIALWSPLPERSFRPAVTKDAGGPSNGKDPRSARDLPQPTTFLSNPSASNPPPYPQLELVFYYTPCPAFPQVPEDTQGLYHNVFFFIKILPGVVSQKSVKWTLVNVAGFVCVLICMAGRAQFRHQGRRPEACCQGICRKQIFCRRTHKRSSSLIKPYPHCGSR